MDTTWISPGPGRHRRLDLARRLARWTIVFGLLCAPSSIAGAPAAARAAVSPVAPQIWFSPTDPVWRKVRGQQSNDFDDLFRSDAAWSGALASVQVVELTKRFVLTASDSELSSVIAALNRHHVALAMQMTPLPQSRNCGLGVESYGPASDMAEAATRVKRLGGVVAYADMDEPLYYGHRFAGRKPLGWESHPGPPCQSAIGEVARQTALKVADLRRAFPNIQVGDTEPLGVVAPSEAWAADIAQWLTAYRAAVGKALAFVDLDLVWRRPSWRSDLLDVIPVLRANGIPLGIIYNASPDEPSDLAWTKAAAGHFKHVESDLGVSPAKAVFMAWTDQPTRILPENQAGTHANLVLQYMKWRRRGGLSKQP